MTYKSEIKLYGRSPVEPVWAAESEALGLNSVFSVDSAEVAADLGKESLLLYGEAYNYSPEMSPPTPNVAMPIHMHFSSKDGSMFGHLASFFIFGAPRSVQRGEFYYENFPCAMVNQDHRLSIYVINPFVRTGRFWVRLIARSDVIWESEPVTLKGKGVAEWNCEGSGCPEFDGPVGVVVKSDLKASSIFATRAGDGKMVGLDHGHPFLQQVLDHR